MRNEWLRRALGIGMGALLLLQSTWVMAQEVEIEAVEAGELGALAGEELAKETFLRQPGFFYTPQERLELEEDIQGIACEGGEYWVSLEKGLLHYDEGWELAGENRDPFLSLEEGKSLGDIDVYEGKVYALVETQEGAMVATYDGQSLELDSCFEIPSQEAQKDAFFGITVDRDNHLLWVGLGGEELLGLDLETGEELGSTYLLDAPSSPSSICAYDGWIYFLADDQEAEEIQSLEGTSPRSLYRLRIDLGSQEAGLVEEESFEYGGESTLGMDRDTKRLLVGLKGEAGAVEIYSMKRNFYPLDYSLEENWISRPEGGEELAMDVFFVLPTVNMKKSIPDNEDIYNLRTASRFQKTYAMEKGLFDGTARVFSPYYRQLTIGSVYPGVDTEPYEEAAYEDVARAFDWFIENHGEDRPFFLFGFSQGSMMVEKLLERKVDEEISKNLVASYLIGTDVTEKNLAEFPQLKMAQSASDTGVIVSYDCVDEIALEKAPESDRIAINPINWTTDGTPAQPEENLGMVQVDTSGQVIEEQVGYCGAYVDERTGYLVATGIKNPEELYITGFPFFPDGSYHMYDLFFFYNNLKENIQTRAAAWESKE